MYTYRSTVLVLKIFMVLTDKMVPHCCFVMKLYPNHLTSDREQVISSTSIDKRTKSNEHSKSSSFHDKMRAGLSCRHLRMIMIKENLYSLQLHTECKPQSFVCLHYMGNMEERNDVIWRNETAARAVVCDCSISLLTGWRNEENARNNSNNQHMSQHNAAWTRPPIRWYKGKVDASFSRSRSKVGISVCIQDDRPICTSKNWVDFSYSLCWYWRMIWTLPCYEVGKRFTT